MENDLKVSFYLKKNEVSPDGTAFVMGYIKIGNTGTAFSTKAKIKLSLWDTKSGRASGKSKDATELNRKLDSLNGLINSRYRELLKSEGTVTAKQLKVAFQGIVCEQAMLVDYFEKYLAEYSKRVGKDRNKSTYFELKNSLNHLKIFLDKKYKLKDIPFSLLTISFIDNYDFHLRITRGLSPRTILEKISRLRRMIKYAINDGIISCDPFSGYKRDYPKPKQKYLTILELESIINKPFSDNKLILAKEMFLFSCFTGLAYTDMYNLTKENIVKASDGMLWIKTKRQKTGVECNIPLLEIPIQIIEKYSGIAKDGKLLPMASNNTVNNNLKTVVKQCGIQRNVVFHSGRHTYASTITLSQNVPIESVSSMLGHKLLSTTNIYAKITNEKIAADIESLEKRTANFYELIQL